MLNFRESENTVIERNSIVSKAKYSLNLYEKKKIRNKRLKQWCSEKLKETKSDYL